MVTSGLATWMLIIDSFVIMLFAKYVGVFLILGKCSVHSAFHSGVLRLVFLMLMLEKLVVCLECLSGCGLLPVKTHSSTVLENGEAAALL